MANLAKAIEIAVNAHKYQPDKYGQPVIQHVMRVMSMGKTENEKILGVLHDVVEDTAITIADLRSEGFSETLLEALSCISKVNDEEDFVDYINRVKKNKLAVNVKLHDLKDNMDINRIPELTEKELPRLLKYIKAYRELINLI